jgi:capsular polysaccharide biosynthesis protein
MTIEEAIQRILRAHLVLILVCLLTPLLITWIVVSRQPASYQASVRIQVSSTPATTTIAASAISSRVVALATTPSLLSQAMSQAGDTRDVSDVSRRHVTASRLGESSIVELSVTDRHAGQARATAAALATTVTKFMNKANRSDLAAALADNAAQTAEVRRARADVADRLATTPERSSAQLALTTKLGGIDQQLSELAQQRTSLALANLSNDSAVVVDATQPRVRQVSSGMAPRLAVAGVFGLMLGLAMSVILEAVRPRVAGTRALARRLQVPVLGQYSDDSADLARSLGFAARRHGADTVVLVGVTAADRAAVPKIVHRFQAPAAADDSAEGGTGGTSASQAGNQAGNEGGQSKRGSVDVDEDLFGPRELQVLNLTQVLPEHELTAGIVVVSSGTVWRPELDRLEDVIATVRWPVLGVIDRHGEVATP